MKNMHLKLVNQRANFHWYTSTQAPLSCYKTGKMKKIIHTLQNPCFWPKCPVHRPVPFSEFYSNIRFYSVKCLLIRNINYQCINLLLMLFLNKFLVKWRLILLLVRRSPNWTNKMTYKVHVVLVYIFHIKRKSFNVEYIISKLIYSFRSQT